MIAKNKKTNRTKTRPEVAELEEAIQYEHRLGVGKIVDDIKGNPQYTGVEVQLNLRMYVIHGNTVGQNLFELKTVLDMWINDLIEKHK